MKLNINKVFCTSAVVVLTGALTASATETRSLSRLAAQATAFQLVRYSQDDRDSLLNSMNEHHRSLVTDEFKLAQKGLPFIGSDWNQFHPDKLPFSRCSLYYRNYRRTQLWNNNNNVSGTYTYTGTLSGPYTYTGTLNDTQINYGSLIQRPLISDQVDSVSRIPNKFLHKYDGRLVCWTGAQDYAFAIPVDFSFTTDEEPIIAIDCRGYIVIDDQWTDTSERQLVVNGLSNKRVANLKGTFTYVREANDSITIRNPDGIEIEIPLSFARSSRNSFEMKVDFPDPNSSQSAQSQSVYDPLSGTWKQVGNIDMLSNNVVNFSAQNGRPQLFSFENGLVNLWSESGLFLGDISDWIFTQINPEVILTDSTYTRIFRKSKSQFFY